MFYFNDEETIRALRKRLKYPELDYPTGHFVRVTCTEAKKSAEEDIYIADVNHIDAPSWVEIIDATHDVNKTRARVDGVKIKMCSPAFYIRVGATKHPMY